MKLIFSDTRLVIQLLVKNKNSKLEVFIEFLLILYDKNILTQEFKLFEAVRAKVPFKVLPWHVSPLGLPPLKQTLNRVGRCSCEISFKLKCSNFLKQQEKCGSKTRKKSASDVKRKKSIKTNRLNIVKNVVKSANREIDALCPICLRRFYHQAPFQV